jgi:hypothetical protein
VAVSEAPLVEFLKEVQPLARQLALVLVRQELAELTTSLNGTASAPVEVKTVPSADGAAPSTKVCTLCGETKPASAFNAGRRQCRQCRNARYRRSRRSRGTVGVEAVVTGDEEPPRTGEVGIQAPALPD